jgi:hypothetical protein
MEQRPSLVYSYRPTRHSLSSHLLRHVVVHPIDMLCLSSVLALVLGITTLTHAVTVLDGSGATLTIANEHIAPDGFRRSYVVDDLFNRAQIHFYASELFLQGEHSPGLLLRHLR